jgi:glycosyltransferase involved in cell wall biosynthesis
MLLANPATYDQRPLKEAHTLAERGYKVTIFAWDRELETKSDTIFDDGLVIRRMRLHAGHGTPVLTVPRLIVFYIWCVVHLMTSSFEAIHCHDVDTLPAGFASKALKLNRPRLVYDMHDLPEAFLKFFPLTSITQKVFLSAAKKVADLVVLVNERFVGHLGAIGFDRRKLVVVMNAPLAREGRVRTRSQDGFLVLYYGWLGEQRGVRLLVDAVQGLSGVTLALAGRGELEGWVRENSRRNPQIVLLGWLKMPALEQRIRQADLIPSLYEPRTRNAKLATPGKLLTSMSMSLPSLVPSGSYQAEIVERFGCGIVVDWRDSSDVRKAIERLSTDVQVYNKMARAAYEAFRTSFSWEVMASKLVEAYGRIVGPS